MSNKIKIKGKLRYHDIWRVVLTDTSPFEVPIIFSNDGFYKNLNDYHNKTDIYKKIIDRLIFNINNYTIPYRYKIVKGDASFRQLSLLHPASQIQISKFYQKYEQLICYYASTSNFSIRFPQKVGSKYYFATTLSNKNKYKNNSIDTTNIEKVVKNPASYFSYN